MLSAAPGFFVDHEDGEGLGNDVYLRGFDLDNGSGIEMKVGEVPINIPLHIHGQGYADVNFIIPEVVRSIRVLEGPYDPRQGDSAIVGSASSTSASPSAATSSRPPTARSVRRGSSASPRPKEASDETFAAFSLRETQRLRRRTARRSRPRSTRSTGWTWARTITCASWRPRTRRAEALARRGAAGRRGRRPHRLLRRLPVLQLVLPDELHIGLVRPARARRTGGADHRRRRARPHDGRGGARFEIAPWVMWTNFLSRQNYTGDLDSSNLQPSSRASGDLWQLTNVETAAGVTSRFHTAPFRVGSFLEVVTEPGVSLRAGHTDQSKSLLNPADLDPWDYRNRATGSTPSTSPDTSTSTSGSGRSSASREARARTFSTSPSTTTSPASCLRSRPARFKDRPRTSPAWRRGRA
jgi:iron complex outermembrane receptor protein